MLKMSFSCYVWGRHKPICACQLLCFVINVPATQPVACPHTGITFYFPALEVVFLTFILIPSNCYHAAKGKPMLRMFFSGIIYRPLMVWSTCLSFCGGVVWTEIFCQMLSC